MDGLKKLAEDRLAATGRNPFEAATRVGLERSFINDILIGKKTAVSAKNVGPLARALEIEPEVVFDLMTGAKSNRQRQPETQLTSQDPTIRQQMPLDLPVFGTAVGGTDADFSFNGEVQDYVRRPPGIVSSKNAYALFVQNDSMAPRFEPGEMLIISTLKPPANGDYVVLETKPDATDRPGRGFVKRLKRRTPTKIVLEQFNPPMELTFDVDQVKLLHRVIPNNELFGV